jgi:hypothetical protein
MSEETTSPVPQETHEPEGTASTSPSASSHGLAFVLVLLLAVGAAGYAFHERSAAKQLAASNTAMTATLNATRDQLNTLTAKVNAMETKPSPEAATKPAAVVYRKPLTAAIAQHRIVDPRWKKMQGQLDEQGRQIASTREDLASTRTELQGSIAKTHDDLVLLQKKGERNYYEFDVDKSGEFQRQGPIGVRLRKANTKHEYADLELMVDDFKVSKKHVNIDEPVVFYPGDEKMPVELVINSIGKNHIHGYVSEPKYRNADLQAMTNSGGSNQATTAADQVGSDGKPSPTRQRLPLPADAPMR